MSQQQLHGIGRDDLLLVVSYHPYAEEAVHLIDAAVDAHCKVLSISDSMVSPVAKPANLVLQVREAEVRKFRSLSSSMCLAQALVIAYAFATAARGSERSAAPAKAARPRKK
jgi:DNA-binding MurR/RpiR family transcriptional regulator